MTSPDKLLELTDYCLGQLLERIAKNDLYDSLIDSEGGEKSAVPVASSIEALRKLRNDLTKSSSDVGFNSTRKDVRLKPFTIEAIRLEGKNEYN